MPYRGLGHPTSTGIQDGTGTAAGNFNPYLPGTGWDVIFTPDDFVTNLTQYEVYQISLDGPIGSSVLICIDHAPWNYVAQGWANSYDPQQPMLLNNGNELEFYWNFPATTPPYDKVTNVLPVVTLWLRADAALLAPGAM